MPQEPLRNDKLQARTVLRETRTAGKSQARTAWQARFASDKGLVAESHSGFAKKSCTAHNDKGLGKLHCK